MNDEPPSEIAKKIELAIKKARFWYLLHWTLLQTARWVGLLCSIIVPFGLAGLIYVKNDPVATRVNVALLFISAFAFALQSVEHFLRLPERADLFRKIWTQGEVALARYRDRLITLEELSAVLERQNELFNDERL